MIFLVAMTAPIFSQSSQSMPMIKANGMNNFPKNHSSVMNSYPMSIPSQPMIEFVNATNDTNATRLAMIPAINETAAKAPFEAASNTEFSDLLKYSIAMRKFCFVLSLLN